MDTTEIKLNFNRADFEELHFKHGNEKVLFSKDVKPQFLLSLVAATLFVASLAYSISAHKFWGVSTITTLIFILMVDHLIRKMAPIVKWKRSIQDFLNEQSKFINQRLTLSESTLTLKQDTRVTIMPWKNFKKIVIDNKSISLYGESDLILPKKSMTWQEFDLLKSEVLKNVTT